jgi:hypothetical protein
MTHNYGDLQNASAVAKLVDIKTQLAQFFSGVQDDALLSGNTFVLLISY